MKICGDGFLSSSGHDRAQQIVARHAAVFHELENVISLLRKFISSQEILRQDDEEFNQKLIALILTVRILEVSEAAVVIMRNGMSNEANTLFRVFLDAYFIICNVCSDASFVVNFFRTDQTARLKLLNVAKKHDSELFRMINENTSDNQRDSLKEKIAEEQIQAFNSYAYAENIGCAEIYDSMYRICSSNLHTTPRALEKYMDIDEAGNILSVKDHPTEGDIPQRIYDFTYFNIKVFSAMKELFGCLNQAEINIMIGCLDRAARNSKK